MSARSIPLVQGACRKRALLRRRYGSLCKSLSASCVVATKWARVITVAAGATLGGGGVASAQVSTPLTPEAASKPALSAEGETPAFLRSLVHESLLSDGEIEVQLAAAKDGSAIAAAWERARRASDQDGTLGSGTEVAPARAQFLGFVEGRLKVGVPETWRAAVSSSRGRTISYFPDAGFSFSNPSNVDKRVLKVSPEAASVRRIDGGFEVRTNDKKWAIVSNLVAIEAEAAVPSTDDADYVAVYRWPPINHPVAAFDKASGKTIWSGEATAGRAFRNYSGDGCPNVELRVKNDTLFVFGTSHDLVYIEAMERRTGKSLWKFNTAYFDDAR
jgi:hypothetical protein